MRRMSDPLCRWRLKIVAGMRWLGVAAGLAGPAAAAPLEKVTDLELLTPRAQAAMVLTEEAAYVIGGYNVGGPLGDIERIDLVTRQVTRLPLELEARAATGAAIVGGKLYVIGGLGYDLDGRMPRDVVDIVDLATGEVSRGQNLPTARAWCGVVVINDRIHVIGGSRMRANDHTQTNRVEIYDPASDTWSEGLAMPTPRDCQAVTVSGFALVAGGYAGRKSLDVVELFVPTERAWKRLPPLGRRTRDYAAVVAGPRLYLFGDYGNESQVLAYDLRTRETTLLEPGFARARSAAAAALGSLVVVAGGLGDSNSLPHGKVQIFMASME